MRLRSATLALLSGSAFICGADLRADAAPSVVRVQIVPSASAVLSAEISARVRRLPLREGDSFAAGDVLLIFDSSLHEAQLQRAESVLLAAQASARASEQLVALKSAGQLDASLANAELQKARAEVRYAQELLSRCTLRAPYAGRIAERRIQEHEFAQSGQPLLEIVADGPPRVEFIAPSRQLELWRPGREFSFRLDETGATYQARVDRIGVRVDPVSQSVKVISFLQGTPPGLMAGMSGTVVAEEPSPR
jgi:RND family efflux transporter MFP subunit